VKIKGNEKYDFYSIQLQCHSTSHSTQLNPTQPMDGPNPWPSLGSWGGATIPIPTGYYYYYYFLLLHHKVAHREYNIKQQNAKTLKQYDAKMHKIVSAIKYTSTHEDYCQISV